MIKIGTNFDYEAPFFLDGRQNVESTVETPYYEVLRNWSTPIPDGFEVFCNGKWWTYKESNPMGVTGKFRERTGSGGGEVSGLTVTIVEPSEDGLHVPYNEFLTELTVHWVIKYDDTPVTPSSVKVYINQDEYVVENPQSDGTKELSNLHIVGGDVLKVSATYNEEVVENSVSFISTYTKYWGTLSDDGVTEDNILFLNRIDGATSVSLDELFYCTGGKYPYYVIPKNIYLSTVTSFRMFVNDLENTAFSSTDFEYEGETFSVIRHDYPQTANMQIRFEGTPMTTSYFKTIGNGEVSFVYRGYRFNPSAYASVNLEYSVNNGETWNIYDIVDDEDVAEKINLANYPEGVIWRGLNNDGFYITDEINYEYLNFVSTNDVYLSGDVTSLINYYGGNTILPSYCFYGMFSNCTKLRSVPNLPSTSIEEGCYQNMFAGCELLERVPQDLLPATILADYCYDSMFKDCSGLTNAPVLLSTMLTNGCYQRMFSGCLSLEDVSPRMLPADHLAPKCYSYMFSECRLSNAPDLPAKTLAESCYEHMFDGCINLQSAPSLETYTLSDYCYRGMFYECTSLKTAPELPAETMAIRCYESMFEGCTQLRNVPILNAEALAPHCCSSMFQECISLSNVPVLKASNLVTGCYNQMFYGCTSLNFIEASFLTNPVVEDSISGNPTYPYTEDWVKYVDRSGIFIKSYHSSWGVEGNSGIPTGWVVKLRHDDGTVTDPAYLGFRNMIEDDRESSFTVQLTSNGGVTPLSIEYSFNAERWNKYIIGDIINIREGNKVVYFRGLNKSISSNLGYYRFDIRTRTSGITGSIIGFGEVTSLLNRYGGDFDIDEAYCFANLFFDNTSLIEVPVLPSVRLSNSCYSNMFKNCDNLIRLPEDLLPATTLASRCYERMFEGCRKLLEPPVLRATTLADYCYSYMFSGCTLLRTAPALPATTLASYCYYGMFDGCSILQTAPKLPATTLITGCYNQMFSNCSSLNYINASFLTEPSNSYTSNWVNGVASSGTFIRNYEATWYAVGNNAIPTGWDIKLDHNNGTITDISYLTFTAKSNNSSVMLKKIVPSSTSAVVEYSLNGGEWASYTISTSLLLEHIDDYVQFRGINSTLVSHRFIMTGSIEASGEVNTLINNIGGNAVLAENCYSGLFNGCTALLTIPVLSSIVMSNNCYTSMFYGCTSLTTATLLPSTTLSPGCYSNMFYGCTNLTTLPQNMLPATTLSDGCYYAMFSGCTSLETAPELPATTLANNCYQNMFSGCTSLTTAPDLPATVLAPTCYSTMFQGCTSLETASDLPATVLVKNCYSYMFQNCTSLETAPELPATTLANYCYNSMFNGCTSLTTVPALPATTLANNCYSNMFQGCTSLETAPELPATTLANYCYNSMFNGCTSLATAPELPATILANSCYSGMFRGCTGLETVFRLPATTLTNSCYSNMFSRCTKLTTVPQDMLPSTTLDDSCYLSMFENCSELTGLPDLPASTLSRNCYEYMFKGCTSLETAPVLSATTLNYECYRGMFSNCTNLETIPENMLPLLSLNGTHCYWEMFSGCTSLKTVPTNMLPATILSNSCYYGMFQGCTELKKGPDLPATNLNDSDACYSYMFSGCTKLETVPDLPANTAEPYCYSYMFENCTGLTTAPALPATTLAEYCYNGMFYGCTSLETAPALPATTLANNCYQNMFSGCTNLTTAPKLPATTLTNSCYFQMFNDCTNLSSITCLATDISANGCTTNWVYGVGQNGTFTKAASMNDWTTGVNDIPSGWTVEDYVES